MDGDIGQHLFDAWFDFSRPNVAAYRDATGAPAEAAIDEPRFDHDDNGVRAGLLVEPGEQLGQSDRVRLQLGAIGATEATVLHATVDENGAAVRRAWYTRDPQMTIDVCLGQSAHHVSIAAVPGFRPNLGGYIRYRGVDWALTRLVGTGTGEAVGDDEGRALIGA